MNCPYCENSISKHDFVIEVKEDEVDVEFECSNCKKCFGVIIEQDEFEE